MKNQLIPILFGAGRFSPLNIPNLAQWYDASNYSSITTKHGMALASASSQYLSVNSTLGKLDNTSFCVWGWVNLTSSGANQTLITDGESDATPYGANEFNFHLYYTHATNKFGWDFQGYGGTTDTATWGSTTSYGTKAFVIAYHDVPNQLIGISVNGGAFVTTNHTLAVGTAPTAEKLRLGANLHSTPAQFGNGTFDEFGMGTGVPQAADVAALYGSGTGSKVQQWGAAGFLPNVTLTHAWKLCENGDTGFTTRSDSTGSLHFAANGGTISAATGLANSTAVDSGEGVSQWNDLSGNSRTCTQATSINMPIYTTNVQGGLPGLSWDGANDILSVASAITHTDVTVVAITNQSNNAQAKIIVGGNSANAFWFGTDSNEKLAMWIAAASNIVTAGSASPIGSGFVGVGQYSSAAASAILRSNAVDVTGAVTPQTIAAASDRIGGRTGPSNWFLGYIHEVLVYTRLLSLAEIQTLEAYAKAKWST